MRFLRWLERKLFLGEVIRDYGSLGELTGVGAPGLVSLLLCKRRGQLQLVVRTGSHFQFNSYPVKVSAALASTLSEAAADVRRLLEAGAIEKTPETGIQAKTTTIREL